MVVENVTLQNSAFWTAHFLLCDGVKIKGVKIYSHSNWNNDGLDIDSRNVEIEDCYIDIMDIKFIKREELQEKPDSKTSHIPIV